MARYHEMLSTFLETPGNSQVALSELIGKSQAAIHRYARALRFPDADTARLIDKHSGGQVPFAVWQAEMMQKLGIAPSDDGVSVHEQADTASADLASSGKVDENSPCAAAEQGKAA